MLFGNVNTLLERERFLDRVDSVLLSDGADVVVNRLLKSKLHRVVVVDNADRVQGIISPKDVLRRLQGEQTQASLENKAQLDASHSQILNKVDSGASVSEALAYYKQLYENAPYMIHSVDASVKIMGCNQKMHEILGYAPGQLIGKSIEDIYTKTFHQDIRDSLQVLMSEGASLQVLSEMITSTGQILHVEVQSSVFNDANKKPVGTISITRVLEEDFSDMLNKEIEEMLGRPEGQ
jgi:PAS domain S-box-containing protein